MQTETNSENQKEFLDLLCDSCFFFGFLIWRVFFLYLSSVFSFEKKRRAEKRKEKEHKLVISYNIEMVH